MKLPCPKCKEDTFDFDYYLSRLFENCPPKIFVKIPLPVMNPSSQHKYVVFDNLDMREMLSGYGFDIEIKSNIGGGLLR